LRDTDKREVDFVVIRDRRPLFAVEGKSGASKTAGLDRRDRILWAVPLKNPGTSAVLSLVIPGVGQFYNGDFLRGLFWLIVTPGLWIGSGGLFGWVCHVIAGVTAYRRAERKNAASGGG